jgi:type III pantothenate kinase
MLLTIDAGNTQTVVGLFRGRDLVDHWRIATDADRTSDELALMVQQFLGFHGFSFAAPKLDEGERAPVERQPITGVAICSGVPRVTAELRQMTERYFGFPALVLEPGVRTGMPILYDNPKEVGADRIVNAVAAYEKFRTELIVVDFGTATTFDYVSKKGEYMGGVISPGIAISSDALFDKASKLPRVELKRPKSIVAKDTISSMQAGIMFGYAGLVDGIVDRMKAETRSNPKVVATGGLAKIIAPETKSIDVVDEFLTLDGLRIIFERNK